MKRTISVLAVVAGVLGAMITGVGPAVAATSAVDCAAGGYTWTYSHTLPHNYEAVAVDGRQYNIGFQAPATYEICLDVPATSTFRIEIRMWANQVQTVTVDDRPGAKVFRFSIGTPMSFWQVYGTMSGPGTTNVPYTWYEKKLPA